MDFLLAVVLLLSIACVLLPAAAALDDLNIISLRSGSTGLGLSFIHRDAPRSPFKTAPLDEEVLARNPFQHVIQHVQAQHARIHNSSSGHHHHLHHRGHHRSATRSPVVTLGQTGLEYYMPLQLGTPPMELLFILDTGSDVSWMQCVPCRDCVPANRRPFNPKRSASFYKLPCTSSTCTTLYQGTKPFCSPSGKTCLFGTQYADGSLSSGLLVLETLHVNTTENVPDEPVKVQNITFGCANIDREGVPTGASGLLGMDRRPISFPSQLAKKFGGKFSYCFPDKISHLNSSGVVYFGDVGISPRHIKYTPILKNDPVPTASLDYYYLNLTGISVENYRLPLSQSLFDIQSSDGSGGTIIDSGTAFTYLKKPALHALTRRFVKKTMHLSKVQDTLGFSPCYNFTNFESASVPGITLHFQGDTDIVLPKNSILIPVTGDEVQTTFCFAFQASDTIPFNIIGNYQQQDLWMEYDLDKLQLGVAKMSCAVD